MPLDGTLADHIDLTAFRPAAMLLYLADHMEGLSPGQVDMRVVHNTCGTQHCAYGWAENLGLVPKDSFLEETRYRDHLGWRSPNFGLNLTQHMHCFDDGPQFYYLNRRPTIDDVVRHLREVAAELPS